MWCNKRHRIVYKILMPLFNAYYLLRYNTTIQPAALPKEGAVVIANHVTTLDPVLMGMKFREPIYFMASKHIFQNRLIGRVLKWLVNPIPKEKMNKSDIASIKNCIQIAKENGSICIFPEGNRTFSGKLGYVDPAIIKLVKHLKKPLIVCNIIGGYGADPRWGSADRRGKMDVVVKKTYSYEQIKATANDELYQMILQDMSVDEYAAGTVFRSRRRAECLESILHICPICGREHTLSSHKHQLSCAGCGTAVTFREDLLLECDNEAFPFRYVHEWYDYQVERMKEKVLTADALIYRDTIDLYKPRVNRRKEHLGSGTICLYPDRITFNLGAKPLVLPLEEVYAITLIGNKIMDIYFQDITYRVMGAHSTNLIKYMHMFYIMKNKAAGDENGFIGI